MTTAPVRTRRDHHATLRPVPAAAGWWPQLRALTRLRWQMVRSRPVRTGLVVLLVVLAASVVAVVVGARLVPDRARFDTSVLAPTALLGFALLAMVAPLTAGGGNELYPSEQLAPYPVRASTVFTASLLIAPLNLVWVSQLLTVLAVSSFLLAPGAHVWPAVALALVYVGAVTVVGQALSWWVVGIRQTRAGRWATWALAAVVAVGAVVIVRTDRTAAVLDHSPTHRIVRAMVAPGFGHWAPWLQVTAVLLGAGALAVAAGVRAVGWALHRPGDAGVSQESRRVRRRAARASGLGELTAVTRASVWRSPALRRGAFVLTVLPGIAAVVAGVAWSSLIVLPGLVAAGAGLLFGVNAFCLDASGAVWLASLPVRPRTLLTAKLLVIAETCAVPVALATVAGALRAPRAPTVTELVALMVGLTVCVGYVSATCLRLSVTRPHRADLRGSRDTPAPPATMAVYSARLAGVTTSLGLVIAGTAASGIWWSPLLVGVPGWLLVARSLVRTARWWDNDARRAHVVTTVAAG